MTTTRTTLALLLTTATTAIATSPAQAADNCPNATLRAQNNSTNLPDCRAYELVSPDLQHAGVNREPAGFSLPTGQKFAYTTIDPPGGAQSGNAWHNFVKASRDPVEGWSGVALSPPLSTPVTSYNSFWTLGLSRDMSSTFELTDQPLSGGPVPPGQNSFVGHPDGTFELITAAGTPFVDPTTFPTYPQGSFAGGTSDFSHVYFNPTVRQSPSDPEVNLNAYTWSEDTGLHLVGVLPDGTPAPNGASFAGTGLSAWSADGRYVAFTADGRLYLRVDDSQTVEIGASQRTVDPDPNVPTYNPVGVVPDGSKVLFVSTGELTNDAYTGRSGGVATDAGRDLYSYDVATGELTDLTVDTNPVDAATGTNVVIDGNGQAQVGASADGSYVYFLAAGKLTPEASSDSRSLYVWHDGEIDYVAKADNMLVNGQGLPFYITPDGQHFAFTSSDDLTGYDNTDQATGVRRYEVFTGGLGSPLECASCRADGTRPTASSSLPGGIIGRIRVMSDDGRRVFFHSMDAVVPEASSGLQQVFQYADGKASPISPLDGPGAPLPGTSASFMDASASGDDVFFASYAGVVPHPNNGESAVFDARVGGGFPVHETVRCSGPACRASVAPDPSLPDVASDRAAAGEGPATPGRASRKVAASKVETSGRVGLLRVRIPAKGRLTVSGRGLKTTRASLSKAKRIRVRLQLTPKAAKALKARGSFRSRVRVGFSAADGRRSSTTLPVTFEWVSARKER